MTSDMTWQGKGVRPQSLEAAREAAHRSGQSIGQWLDSVILESTRHESGAPARRPDSDQHPETDEVPQPHHRTAGPDERHRVVPDEQFAEISTHLDILSRQLERLTGAAKGRRDEEGRHQIAGARSRLERRLNQLIGERGLITGNNERRVGAIQHAIAANPEAPRPTPASATHPLDQTFAGIAERQRILDNAATPPRADQPRALTQGLGNLEQQLRDINARIETLRPCAIDGAVDSLRDDLAEIAFMIKEAMPRHAIEALETEVRSLAQRIDSRRDADTADLPGVERALAEVRDALCALTPAESLVGFEAALQAMSQKIDGIAAITQDPALEHLEDAIVGLRSIISHVASNAALAKLSDEVHTLAAKVERVASADGLAMVERRVSVIADALESRPHTDQDIHDLEALVRELAAKIERLRLTGTDRPATQTEERIARLVEKLESSDARLGQLDAIERGLAELLLLIDRQRASQQAPCEAAHRPDIDNLKRDVRRTQDLVEAMHGTLEHMVDRLAMIETGLRSATEALQPAAVATVAPASTELTPAAPAMSPLATLGNPAPVTDRRPIDPDLPPDHPIEPGASRGRSGHSAADRIAASEAALAATRPPAYPDRDEKSNFIAAARRAAQAASDQTIGHNNKRTLDQPRRARLDHQPGSRPGNRVHMLLVAASVVAIVLGSLHALTGLFSKSDNSVAIAPGQPSMSGSSAPSAPDVTPAPAPSPGRQSGLLPGDMVVTEFTTGLLAPPETLTPSTAPLALGLAASRGPLVTGSIRPPSPAALSTMTAPPPTRPTSTDKLPATMASGLRAAAAKGDPAAEFEVAVRFAEGRGVPQNFPAAAEWFERAAMQGLAPAQFRLGSLYEKGMGRKKDLDAARRLYVAAAQAGNAKAMHNLAVLYAEGIDGKPDYQIAANWFRKAAGHGVTDSQYNLGILYARGIGVEADLAEAYKWFALAAREGDRESAKKRDDLRPRLDQATAAAAHAAVRAWTAEPQPEAATQVKTPPGGWSTPAPSATKRRARLDAKTKRTTP